MTKNMRHRVAIQAPAETQDAAGQVNADGTYTTSQTRWAAVIPLTGRQLEVARQLVSEITHRFEFRWFAFDIGHRLLHDGRTFEVLHALDPDEKKTYLHVYAVERMADG
jgi:SPP1 family predicted phage head-tail adaptor